MLAGVWASWGRVLLATVLGAPFAALVAAALVATRRRRGVDGRWAVRASLAEVGLVYGELPWLWMILTPEPGGTRRISVVPLRDLTTLAPRDVLVQVGGNLLAFAALGFFLPIRWPVGIRAVLLAGCCAALLVETAQYAFALGRVSSVDDVLVNALGAVLFGACSRPWWRRRAAGAGAGPARSCPAG